jgi:hypothetical protein
VAKRVSKATEMDRVLKVKGVDQITEMIVGDQVLEMNGAVLALAEIAAVRDLEKAKAMKGPPFQIVGIEAIAQDFQGAINPNLATTATHVKTTLALINFCRQTTMHAEVLKRTILAS